MTIEYPEKLSEDLGVVGYSTRQMQVYALGNSP
jgi:hypothetical protein